MAKCNGCGGECTGKFCRSCWPAELAARNRAAKGGATEGTARGGKTVTGSTKVINDGKTMFVVSPQMKQYGDQPLSQGELFRLQGLRNDDALLKYNYAKPFTGEDALVCGECQRQFAHQSGLTGHARTHKPGVEEPNRLLTDEERFAKPPAAEEVLPPSGTHLDLMKRGEIAGMAGAADMSADR